MIIEQSFLNLSFEAESNMTIAIILGTRPEIIKMAPIIRDCWKRALDFIVLHTGQHYFYQTDQIFFELIELSQPHHNLDLDLGSSGGSRM
jgi:UDP-N-acetylglucosamine 2-epimerase (non-hydrolysing)